jgi:hypothetical protein
VEKRDIQNLANATWVPAKQVLCKNVDGFASDLENMRLPSRINVLNLSIPLLHTSSINLLEE